ncbi:MAG: UbiX family flavin prenyltransferase [Candidatus Heimdallarchaeota archaeon]
MVAKIKLIVGICGASGVEYGIDVLNALNKKEIETHLVLSKWAEPLIEEETNYTLDKVKTLATVTYDYDEMDAAISSSSFLINGMVICPATVKTVSEIANANLNNLITRAANTMLRTRKQLIVCLRETPLSAPSLQNLYQLALYGAIIMPLSPAFYHKPRNLRELRAFIVGKVLDLFGIPNEQFKRWG